MGYDVMKANMEGVCIEDCEAVLNVSEAREQLGELLDRVLHHGAHVLLGRRGKAIAGLVSLSELRKLRELEDKEDLKAVREVRKNPQPVPWRKAVAQM